MEPIIKTSSWFTKLPQNHVRIGISRGTPRGQKGYRRCIKLQPGPWFASLSDADFTKRYNEEILADLDPRRVVDELLGMAGPGKIPTLLCWEPPEPGPRWCHRGLVAAWLFDTL